MDYQAFNKAVQPSADLLRDDSLVRFRGLQLPDCGADGRDLRLTHQQGNTEGCTEHVSITTLGYKKITLCVASRSRKSEGGIARKNVRYQVWKVEGLP